MDQEAGAVIERRALQIAIAIAALVPVAAGILGITRPGFLDLTGTPASLTHAAYLSGLLLGIGLGFWSAIPAIEAQGGRFTLLTALVMVGGLARLVAAIQLDVWNLAVILPLAMELGVTPALWLWRRRVGRVF
jgi:hypothetical protein